MLRKKNKVSRKVQRMLKIRHEVNEALERIKPKGRFAKWLYEKLQSFQYLIRFVDRYGKRK